MNLQSPRVHRATIELIVIVAGILIAVGAESWWQDRQDARLERDYLEAFKVDIERTIEVNDGSRLRQDSTQQAMKELASLITAGAPLPATILRVFPSIFILAESMDTYRDLVTTGGITRIESLEVRRVMSQLLRSVEYKQLGERWALDLVTSIRAANLAAPRPVGLDRLADTWSVYLDTGDRLLDGIDRLSAQADTALAVVQAELGARQERAGRHLTGNLCCPGRPVG